MYLFDNIIYTFDYFDRPILFVCGDSSSMKLVSLIEDNYDYEKWLVSPLSSFNYEALCNSHIDFFTCFKEKINELEVVKNRNGQITSEKNAILSINELENICPKKGLYANQLKPISISCHNHL